MVGLAKACEAVLGTAQAVAGFTLAPTAPASLSAVLGPGQVFQQAQLEATPFSTLPADGHTVVKQGILIDAQTLTFTPPSASGYAQNFLVEVQYQDADAGATVLPYYNAGNPQVGFSGPGGAGTAQNTVRRGAVAYQIKAGVAATAGTQTSPAPDAGWAGLYVVTMAQGATTITAGNITLYAGAPFIPVTLPGVPRGVQSGQWEFGVASGTNAYTVALSPAPLARPQGMEILVYIPPGQANTGAATLNDGLGLVPFVRQGGGVLASGDVSGFVPIVFDGASWRVNGPVTSDILALIAANAPRLSTVNPVIYVRTDGNDANTGASNTAGTALVTIATAYVLASKYFIPGGQVTIQLGIAGTYAAASPPSGLGTPVVISGDAGNQDLYIISGNGSGTSGVFNHSSGNVSYNGVKLNNTANTTSLLSVAFGASVTLSNLTFAASAGNTQPAVNCFPGGSVTVGPGIKVVSNFGYLFYASNNGVITCQNGSSVTMAGGPAFSTATVAAVNGARISAGGASWSGVASGTRYLATNGAGIDTNGGGVNYIPGSTAGVSTTGYYT